MQTSNYTRNPVVAALHRYDQPAIGTTRSIQKTDTGIIAEIEFLPPGIYPLADQLYEMYNRWPTTKAHLKVLRSFRQRTDQSCACRSRDAKLISSSAVSRRPPMLPTYAPHVIARGGLTLLRPPVCRHSSRARSGMLTGPCPSFGAAFLVPRPEAG